MSGTQEQPALAHIEKMLADSYRKEIDQEENIWRSLPFFAATLALQLAALFQVVERLPSGNSWTAVTSHLFVVASFLCSLVALGLLAWSIFPARFRYVAKDVALLEYALGLIDDECHPDNQAQTIPTVALHTLKSNLATQYAVATDNNRQINKKRERRRSIAGLLTLLSVVSTLVLVAVTFTTYIPRQDAKGPVHEPPPIISKRSGPARAQSTADQPATPAAQPARPASAPPSPADAGSH